MSVVSAFGEVIKKRTCAVTATADGTGTGQIPAGVDFVTITAASANDVVTLPSNVAGMIIRGMIGANGCEIWCLDAGAKINDIVCGATNEAALPADRHFIAECISATEWILQFFTHLGAVGTAIVPDAR